ncbi:MAG: hypothetical protein L3J52_01155 [Proteobacteria bacterium]|nr:hypothetical protein [Pseudomonadota bacterium]
MSFLGNSLMPSFVSDLEKTLRSHNLTENFYFGITELFYELGIDGQNFVDDFINSYLEKVSKHSKTKGQVILDTGFTKYQVRNFFNGIKKQSGNTEKNYYLQSLEKLKETCLKEPDHTIPIKSANNSFNNLLYNIEKPVSMITPKMLLISFVKKGFVEKIGTKHIRYITNFQTGFDNNKNKVLQVFCDTVERLSSTLLHNTNAQTDSKTRNQMSYYSIFVDKKHHEIINKGVKEILRKALIDCQECIDGFEEQDEFAKRKVDAQGLEIGVSTFFFINRKR